MRDDFLTIPDAPNYEINSELICRNKKTGHVLKVHRSNRGYCSYNLYVDGTPITRSPLAFRRLALSDPTAATFAPIPSLDYRYEINRAGTVRNAKSKRIVKTTAHSKKSIVFRDANRNFICRHIDELLWEVYGKKFKPYNPPCPCVAENNHRRFSFPSLHACARFLADKLFYTESHIARKLCKRPSVIGEWKISYPVSKGYPS